MTSDAPRSGWRRIMSSLLSAPVASAGRRRKGVLATVALATLTVLGTSCSDGPAGLDRGTVRVTIDGLEQGFTSAGSARISGETIETITIVLPAISSGEARVPAGDYDVVYDPPEGYEMAAGSPDSIVVSVRAGETTNVAFEVVRETGALRIAVSGIVGAAGGTAIATRAGQTPLNLTIPSSGTLDTTVTIGSYHIVYTPPAGHTIASGQSNEANVNVTKTAMGVAAFAVIVASGTLILDIDGIDSSAVNGGSASVLRTDVGGQTPITVNVPKSGVVESSLVPGTYSVDYTPPSGHGLVAGEQNPKNRTVPEDGSVTATFAVEQLDVPAGVIFHSDFSTALGKTTAALLDTGKELPWDLIAGNGELNEVVVAADSLEFPTANVLSVMAGFRDGGGAAAQNHRLDFENQNIPIPPIGGSLFYRWYTRVTAPNSFTKDDLTHPIQDGRQGGATNWMFEVVILPNGTWNTGFNVNGPGGVNNFPNNRWEPPVALPKHETFRVELQVHRVGENTWQMHARIFEADGTLLYDDDDFHNSDESATLADTPTFNFNVLNHLQGFQIGFNGLANGDPSDFPFRLYYQGGVCIRTDTWCGPYAGGI